MLFILTGCNDQAGVIELVLPNGYHGIFQIICDGKIGILPKKTDGKLIYHIPPNGILFVKSLDPFTTWKSRVARYENGSKILPEVEAAGSEIAFYNLSLVNDQKGTRIYFLIGSKDEADTWYKHRP